MFEKWNSKRSTVLGLSEYWKRAIAPNWNRVGPKWFSSTKWPSESLASMQYGLLSLLAIAHAERLEIRPLVEAFADEHRGRYRRRLRLLARRMDGNASLQAALESTPDSLNDNTVLALRFGSQSGTLAKTYEQLIEDEKPCVSLAATGQSNDRGYWFILAATLLLVFQLLMFFIAPTFKKVSQESEIAIPASLRTLLVTYEFAWAYMPLVLLAIGALSWLVWSSPTRRFLRKRFSYNFIRANSLSLSAQLFRMLAVAVEAGRPLPGSLSTLAKYHFDKQTRQQLLIARNEVEQGVPGWFSLVDAKIITPEEFQVLNAAASNRVQSWTLRRMASVKQEKVVSRSDTYNTLLRPVVILAFAAVLLWISYSFFSFITNMIQSLAR